MRIGQGYDLHRLEEGRPLIIGGVKIDHPRGLAGHSDADVLVHAITDALLGALALGDIGSHFPDNDPRFKDANSLDLLQTVAGLVSGAGYRIVNVDSTVVAQQPKLRPYMEAIRQRVADALSVRKQLVSVKAKTNELVGPEGREEAISAQAVVLLEESGA